MRCLSAAWTFRADEAQQSVRALISKPPPPFPCTPILLHLLRQRLERCTVAVSTWSSVPQSHRPQPFEGREGVTGAGGAEQHPATALYQQPAGAAVV